MASTDTPEVSPGRHLRSRGAQLSWLVRLVRRVGRLREDAPQTTDKLVHGAGGIANAVQEVLMNAVPAVALAASGGDLGVAASVMAIQYLGGAPAHVSGEEIGTRIRLAAAEQLGTSVSEDIHGHGHSHGFASLRGEEHDHEDGHGHEESQGKGQRGGHREVASFAAKASLLSQFAAGAIPIAALVGTHLIGPSAAVAGAVVSAGGLAALGVAGHEPGSNKPRWRSALDNLKLLPLMTGLGIAIGKGVQPLVSGETDFAGLADQPLLLLSAGLLAPYAVQGARGATRGIAGLTRKAKARCVARKQTHQVSIERSKDVERSDDYVSPRLAAMHRQVAELHRMAKATTVVAETSSRPGGRPKNGGRARFSRRRGPR